MRSYRSLIACIAVFTLFLPGCRIPDPTTGQSIKERTPSPANYQSPTTFTTYGPSPEQLVDIYPAQGNSPSGIALVYVHGGGWVSGDRSLYGGTWLPHSPFFQHLMDNGHVGFSIDYTLAREPGVTAEPAECTATTSPYPDNLNDVKWAIGWANLESNKLAYGYSKVVVVGESAGGHLAGLAGVTSDQRPVGMPATYNIRPDAVITVVGPVDMTTLGEQGDPNDPAGAFQEAVATGGFANPVHCFFGPDFDPEIGIESVDIELREAVSVQTHVDPSDPPFYIVSVVNDVLVPSTANGDVLEQAYEAMEGDFYWRAWNDRIELEDGNHLTGYWESNAEGISEFLTYLANGDFD
jgi:acetyl esterase/lipase